MNLLTTRSGSLETDLDDNRVPVTMETVLADDDVTLNPVNMSLIWTFLFHSVNFFCILICLKLKWIFIDPGLNLR